MLESVMNRANSPVSGVTHELSRPSHQAYQLLHFGFMAAPIIAGLDKFLHVLTNWDIYLAPAMQSYLRSAVTN